MTLYAVLCLLLLEALQEFTHWIITVRNSNGWSCFSKKLSGISPSTSKRLSQNTNNLAPNWLHLPAYTHFWNNRPPEHGGSCMWCQHLGTKAGDSGDQGQPTFHSEFETFQSTMVKPCLRKSLYPNTHMQKLSLILGWICFLPCYTSNICSLWNNYKGDNYWQFNILVYFYVWCLHIYSYIW